MGWHANLYLGELQITPPPACETSRDKVSSMLAKFQRDILGKVERAAANAARRDLGVIPCDTPLIELPTW